MSKRKSARGSTPGLASPIIGIVLLVLVAGVAWFFVQRGAVGPAKIAEPSARPNVKPAEATGGAVAAFSGSLHAAKPPQDPQLRIDAGANAVGLLRRVEMLQWQEKCAAKACDYALVWSEFPVDSTAFREQKGHGNVKEFPFSSARFFGDDLRLGSLKLDKVLAMRMLKDAPAVALPVHAADLPPNLAATFREQDGLLYAGADPAKPTYGDIRVGYRVIAGGERRIDAVQVGDRLVAPPKNH